MVEGTGLPINSNRASQVRSQQPVRTENARADRNNNSEEADRFEPSDELAARESNQTETANAVRLDEGNDDGGNIGAGAREPLRSEAEAAELVSATASLILGNADNSGTAQGNLDRDTVLALIA